jgi:hypothetical protein
MSLSPVQRPDGRRFGDADAMLFGRRTYDSFADAGATAKRQRGGPASI